MRMKWCEYRESGENERRSGWRAESVVRLVAELSDRRAAHTLTTSAMAITRALLPGAAVSVHVPVAPAPASPRPAFSCLPSCRHPAALRTPTPRVPSASRGGRFPGAVPPPLSMGCAAGGVAAMAPPPAGFTQEGFEAFLVSLQSSICDEAAAADGSGKVFGFDKWQRGEDASNGYGITRVLEGGNLLEKAAANVSIVRGHLSEARAKAMSARGRGVDAGASYFAGALSLVFHPCSPHVPTFRSDIRYFAVEGSRGWFGGGADLTPCYLFEEDARKFHTFYKSICDKYSYTLYEESKAACDAYFYIPARKEHRGTGGIFFDDLESFQKSGDQMKKEPDTDAVFSFVKDVAEGFMPSYLPIANLRRTLAYGEAERQWQLLRRGRYLEFNLLYDRGVKFGLDGGRIESIMVSAPPLVAWKYDVTPEPGSREAQLLKILRKPQSWT